MKTKSGSINTENLVPAGDATAGSAVELLDLTDEGQASIQVTGTYTGALTVQGRVNGATWVDLPAVTNIGTSAEAANIASASVGIFRVDIGGFDAVRVSANEAVTGAADVVLRAAAGVPATPGATSSPISGQEGVSGGSGPVDAQTQRTVSASAQNVSLLATAARTATGTGAAAAGLGSYRAAEFQLDVTAAATETTDTLDVFVQTTIDGANWIDIAHFTQVLGDGGAKRFVAKVAADVAEAMFEVGTALAAGSVRHLLGDQYRVRWDVVDAGTVNASFTFGVTANFVP